MAVDARERHAICSTHYVEEEYFDQKLRELKRTKGVGVECFKAIEKHPRTGWKIEQAIGTIKSKLRAKGLDGEKWFVSLKEIVRG
ncbi:MAG: hypothetical protein QW379_04655 [Thermoplasmata archaeon]